MPFCKCNRYLLTVGQIELNLECELCQKEEHAKTFKERLEEENKNGNNE